MSKQIKFVEKTVRPSEQLVDHVEQKMAAWLQEALADFPETLDTANLTRDTLALCLKQAYLAGVEAGITAVNSLSPFAGILHDAKEGLLVRN